MPHQANPLPTAAIREALTRLAVEAARLILSTKATARAKPDGSPVTEADLAAQAHLVAGVHAIIPGLAIVAEESASHADPGQHALALIDPLDGTREFVAGRAEYTVNLALIDDGVPVWGVVAAPALGVAWHGGPRLGAQRLSFDAREIGAPVAIHTRAFPRQGAVALVSRSHPDPATAGFLDRTPGIARIACGSALKFCRIAEGVADLYPRLAPTMEWDVAAGHAVIEGAGGIVSAADGSPLRYGRAKEGYRIAGFMAWGDRAALRARLAGPAPSESAHRPAGSR